MTPYTIDKTQCWFGIDPTTGVIHCFHREHRLCDSAPSSKTESVVTDHNRPCCTTCIQLLNTAVHSSAGARYGAH